MWQVKTESIDQGHAERFVIGRDNQCLSFEDVLALWSDSVNFRDYFTRLLVESPFKAFRWETPCVTLATLHHDFEFVLIRSDGLDRKVDAKAFRSHFRSDTEIVTFPNLGRNAVMVVPCPIAKVAVYGHLASFVRNAPNAQVHRIWREVSAAMRKRISMKPVWLSTAGMGVSWLHIRLDDRPKYYHHAAYRTKR